MDGPEKHYVNGKNPDKRLLLYDSTYMPCPSSLRQKGGSQVAKCWTLCLCGPSLHWTPAGWSLLNTSHDKVALVHT